ncbi:aminotransferase class V-fold PLP-dependent enzyme [Frondihabitans australicus]|uniref:Selenocysteine lyase/cysteine desulfurase n=1 Tax=Frondihabitans australicus TaxID=386892 RepID=A0A495IH24_9MICO|nr:aminotransferase class V-fold PLP-dependent enzyme [Frondihabitans australicus]RKR74990.1 selenocysteine lyase/cysteine desulfurase [Frondihabitans australicus]
MTTIDEFAEAFDEDPGYLDFAAYGPMSRAVLHEESALGEILVRARYGAAAVFDEQDIRVREAVRRVTGLPTDRIVFQPNASTGLMHALFGLSGQVLYSAREYPSIPIAAQRAAQALHTLDHITLQAPQGVVTPAVIRDNLTPATTAVAVSLVDYRTGYLADLEGIRDVIGDRMLVVDAIQGFGVVDAPYEVADVVVSGGQKWVRAGWGTGFLGLSERAATDLVPLVSGTSGTIVPLGGSYEEVPPPLQGAAAFQVTRADPIAQARFATALEAVAEVGVAAVQQSIAEKVSRLIDIADEFALPVVSSRDESHRAGIVVLEPSPEQLTPLTAELINHGVTATVRGGLVRLSAHVSTGEATFEALRGALTSYGSSLSY